MFNVIRGNSNIFDFGIWLNDDGSIWGIIYRFKIVWKFMIFFESFEWIFISFFSCVCSELWIAGIF